MVWMYVLAAAAIEVFWVIGLKYSDSFFDWTGTILAIILSFFLIIKACEKLPSGTVYAVFTGLGAAAIVVIDSVYFGSDLIPAQLFFIALILIGVTGIKLTAKESGEK